jgi:hypothetical protein
VNFLIKLLIFAPNIFDPLRNTIGAKEYIFVMLIPWSRVKIG